VRHVPESLCDFPGICTWKPLYGKSDRKLNEERKNQEYQEVNDLKPIMKQNDIEMIVHLIFNIIRPL